MNKVYIFLLYLILIFSAKNSLAQFNVCESCPGVTTYYVDLSANSDTIWTSPEFIRNGLCCHGSGSERCIKFIVTVNPLATNLSFTMITPPIPPSMEYGVDCGVPQSVNEPLCINGPGPYCLVYCKPGGDNSAYQISISREIAASPDIAVNNGCIASIWAAGLSEGSMLWNTIYPGTYGQYNSYLSCTSGCDTTWVTPLPGYPPYIDIEVSGAPETHCTSLTVKDTVRVYFVGNKSVSIAPDNPAICFGGVPATLTATPSGGAPPYTYLWSTGETAPSISVNIPGTYWVQMRDTLTNCPPVYDTVVVTAHTSYIAASAGSDISVCALSPTVVLNGSIIMATGGIWSGGTGSFNPNNTALNAGYTPSATELTNGFANLILTTTGNGGCPFAKDTVKITYLPIPTINAGSDQTICANNGFISLNGSVIGSPNPFWSTTGTGYYTPTNAMLNPVYVLSNIDTLVGWVNLILSTNDGCGNVKDTMHVSIIPAPYVNAGPDILACKSLAPIQLNGIVSGTAITGIWSTSGSGYFLPNNADLNATYIPSNTDTTNGSVNLILTSTNNGNCNPVIDILKITFLNAPIVNAGSDQTICQGSNANVNAIITGGSGSGIWTTNGTGVFAPNQTSLNATYTPSNADITAGSVVIIFTTTNNGGCIPANDNITISFKPAPIVNAGNDKVVCANNPLINIAGTLTNATTGIWTSSGTGIFSPSNTNLITNYLPSPADTAAHNVTLTLTSTDGCGAISDAMTLNIYPAPYVNAGTDIYICVGTTNATLHGIISGISTTGVWTTLGSGTFTPSTNFLNANYNLSAADVLAGNVTLILTSTNNGLCLPVKDTVKIIITDPPTSVNAGVDRTICANDSVMLSGIINSVTNTGIWTSNGTGVFLPNSTALNAIYAPSTADTTSGTVTLTLTTTQTCSPFSDQLVVTFLDAPAVNAGADRTVCQSSPNVVLNGSISTWALPAQWTSNGTGVFNPNNTALNATYQPSAADILAGNVYLILKSTNNGICNPTRDTIIITILKVPIVNAGVDFTICQGTSVNLNGSIVGGSGSGIWTTTGTGAFAPSSSDLITIYNPSNIDTSQTSLNFTLTTTNNSGCPGGSDVVQVFFSKKPVVNAGTNVSVCANNSNIILQGSIAIASNVVWTSSGTGIFNPSSTLLNTNYFPSAADINNGNVLFTLTSNATAYCSPVIDTMKAIIYAAPFVNAGSDKYICQGTTIVGLQGTVSGITNSGAWSTLGSGTFLPNNQSLITTYQLSAADILAGYVTIVLTSTNNVGCLPITDTLKIYITNIPTVNAGADFTVCKNNANINLNGLVAGVSSTGIWIPLSGTGIFSPNETSLSTTFIPSLATIESGSISFVLLATNSCIPVRDTINVFFSPAPIVNAGTDIGVCQYVPTVTMNGIISGPTLTGAWTSSGTGFFDNPNDLSTIYHVSNADTAAGFVRIILTSTLNANCNPVKDTMFIYFGKAPIPNFTLPAYVCSGDTFSLSGLATTFNDNVVTWQWNLDDGSEYNTQNFSHVFTIPGSHSISLSVITQAGCQKAISKNILVRPQPIIAFTNTQPTCNNQTITFNSTSPDAITWNWNFGNGQTSNISNPLPQLYPDTGTYNASLLITDIFGCKNSLIEQVRIYAAPLANYSYTSLCQSELVSFTDISIGAPNVINTWLWDFGDGFTSTNQNPSHVFSISDTLNISLIVTTDMGCSDTVVKRIAPYPDPLIIIPDSSNCEPFLVNFNTNITNAISYLWNFGDGSNSAQANPTHLYYNSSNNDTTYNVTLYTNTVFGCLDTTRLPITVYPKPLSQFNYLPTSGCSPLNISFNNLSINGANYSWSFGDGSAASTLSSPQHIFTNTSSATVYYPVRLITQSIHACADSSVNYVTIFGKPNFNFVVNPDTACNPATVNLIGPINGSSYSWNYGDGSYEVGPYSVYHTYTNYGSNDTTYQIRLIGASMQGCIDTTYNQVVVRRGPQASFSVAENFGCTPFTVSITNTSVGAISYQYNFGDGSPILNTANNSVTHIFTNNTTSQKTFTITLTVFDALGCSSVYSRSVNVYPPAFAAFTVDSIGCSPLTLNFTNLSQFATSFVWNFGDNNLSTNQTPTHTYINDDYFVDTTFYAYLIAISPFGCRDTSTIKNIQVNPKPDAFFTLENTAGCAPFNAAIYNATIGGSAFNWDLGDGSTSTLALPPLYHLYQNIDTGLVSYQITLIASNTFGCKDTVYENVNVYPQVDAQFSLNNTGCSPHNVLFGNQSIGAAYYNWDYGDGNSSTNIAPTHTYTNPGNSTLTYNAQLITISSYLCRDTIIKPVTVYPKPIGKFVTSATSGCAPLNLMLIDSTINASTFNWNFGNGDVQTTSTFINDYQYNNNTSAPISYQLSLLVSSVNQCTDTVNQSITVYPLVTSNFSASPSEGCNPLSVSFHNSSQNALTYTWQFGDGGVSGFANPQHTFVNNSTSNQVFYTYLYATSQFNCHDTLSVPITVHPQPIPSFSATPSFQFFPNATVTIANNTVGNWNYNWSFGDGFTSTLPNPGFHTYATWGIYNIILEVSNQFCSDTLSHTIQIVQSMPVADYDSASPLKGCVPLTVSFINKSFAANWYRWDFGDGGTSDDVNPTYTYYKPGSFVVTLKAISNIGEDEINTILVQAYPVPSVFFHVEPNIIELPNKALQCYNLTDNGSTYSWNFGDGSTSTEFEPSYFYTKEGIYDISLTAWSDKGCVDSMTLYRAVVAQSRCVLLMPNAFTPNPDGPSGGAYNPEEVNTTNDIFHPLYQDIYEYQLEVFNRWGELIFLSNDINIGWDGYYHGKLQKPDVYVWKVKAKCISGKEIIEKGTITLIR